MCQNSFLSPFSRKICQNSIRIYNSCRNLVELPQNSEKNGRFINILTHLGHQVAFSSLFSTFRFQLRRTPVTEADDNELDQEARWIWNFAFDGDRARTVSQQVRLLFYVRFQRLFVILNCFCIIKRAKTIKIS